MIKALTGRFKILLELARRQPSVRQLELAKACGMTPQAVSEYMRELIRCGYVESRGPINYRLTKKSYEELLKQGREFKNTTRLILDDILEDFNLFTALAKGDIKEGAKVGLKMEEGLLYAGNFESHASGRATADASAGEDIGIAEIDGIVELSPGRVTILVVPRVEEGGSRRAELDMLKPYLEKHSLVGALGVEALAALRKVPREPDVFFGVREVAVEASSHGISPLIVGAEDEIEPLVEILERKSLPFAIKSIKK